MSTAPFNAEVETLVTQAHAQRVTCKATTGYQSGFATVADLQVISGTVEWDDSRIPRVSARLTIPVPDTQGVIDALDPRILPRVRVTAGYRLGSGTWDDQLVANLQIRSRSTARPDNTVELVCTSDESTLTEIRFADAPTAPDLTVDAQAYVTGLVQDSYPDGDEPTVVWNAPTQQVTAAESQGDWWSKIVDILDVLDVDLWDNGDRVIRVAPRPYVASTTDARLTVGSNGTILRSDAGMSRDDWANFVTILYTPLVQPTTPVSTTGSARVTGGPFSVGVVGVVAYSQDRVGRPTQTQANAACAALLRRMLSRSRSLSLDAVAMWWLRPGRTITVQLPLGEVERVLVASVSFDLATARMSVVTRTPDDTSNAQIGP